MELHGEIIVSSFKLTFYSNNLNLYSYLLAFSALSESLKGLLILKILFHNAGI